MVAPSVYCPGTIATSVKRRRVPSLPEIRLLLGAALRFMHFTSCWHKATRILARFVRGFLCRDREAARDHPSAAELRAAQELQFMASAPASIVASRQGKLHSLGTVHKKGEVFIQGRVAPEDMAAVLGCSQLRVLMPSTRLAYLILTSCHREDHRRDPRDMMARARSVAWIPRARQLALKVLRDCFLCRKEDKKLAEQQMGELPSFKTGGIAPFEAVACDFMGPYQVKGMCGGRRRFKVWIAAYSCFSSHYTVLLATPGYDTQTFVTTHSRFCNTYAPPKLMVVDSGPQLVAAAERPDWQEVARASGWGSTSWKIVHKGTHWRAGQVERVVGMAKKTMNRLLEGQAFCGDFPQLAGRLARIQWLLNSRPVATHCQTETDFHLISPNDIVLGKAARPRGAEPSWEELEEPGVTLKALSHMEQVARAWHTAFVRQAWPLLVPRHKWRDLKPNLQVGDVGFLLHTSKFSKPTWRACRVLQLHPDMKGVVRIFSYIQCGLVNYRAGLGTRSRH
jgi:hypothetical protein